LIDIRLTPEEVAHCEESARAVNENKYRNGLPDNLWTVAGEEPDPLATRSAAFRAEYALAKYLGLGKLTWKLYKYGDGRIDLVIPFPCPVGRTIQVKHRNQRQRDMATAGLDFHHELQADLYVLTWPLDKTDITLVGWCTRDDFLQRIAMRPPVRMNGLKYEMCWDSDLRSMPSLYQEVQEARENYAADRDAVDAYA
jgi:hypothetical protein